MVQEDHIQNSEEAVAAAAMYFTWCREQGIILNPYTQEAEREEERRSSFLRDEVSGLTPTIHFFQ